MTKESDIVYEKGDYWILKDKSKKLPCYAVYKNGATHSTFDSAYALNRDGLSIAKARVDYLAKPKTKKK